MSRIRITRLYIEKLILLRSRVENEMKTHTAKHLERLYQNMTEEIQVLNRMKEDAELDYVETILPKPFKNYVLK